MNQFYLMDSAFQIVDSVWMEKYTLDSHDFIAMENGHFLIFGLELRTIDVSAIVVWHRRTSSSTGKSANYSSAAGTASTVSFSPLLVMPSTFCISATGLNER